MIKLMEALFEEALERRASDLHFTAGLPPTFRIDGTLIPSSRRPLTPEDTQALFQSIASDAQAVKLREIGEIDFSYAMPKGGRVRVNSFKQRGTVAMALRLIADKIPTLESLEHPPVVRELAARPHGLVLVTGPAGSGKSTTLAAMIQFINRQKAFHIITLEDPIEYVHDHLRSMVTQREISVDSLSFGHALRAALRQDPDVILVGEMRDAETMATAITAAETGHLVLATLHTYNAAQTIDRIVDAFPPHQMQQVRSQLSMTLQGVLSQKLLPRKNGFGRVAAMEIMRMTPAIRNLVREGKTPQILSHMQTGGKFGMQTMDMALEDLLRRGLVAREDIAAHLANSVS